MSVAGGAAATKAFRNMACSRQMRTPRTDRCLAKTRDITFLFREKTYDPPKLEVKDSGNHAQALCSR